MRWNTRPNKTAIVLGVPQRSIHNLVRSAQEAEPTHIYIYTYSKRTINAFYDKGSIFQLEHFSDNGAP